MWLPNAADALSGMGLLPASSDVLLVDMASYRPPDELRMVMSEVKNVGRTWKLYMPETERFATKVLQKSGLSPNNTYLPPAVHPCHTKNPDNSHGTSHYEAEMVMIGAVRDLMNRTQTKPEDVDILITCASIWCATPSQASMLVNHFEFRHDIQSYHLGGMGCATGVLLMSLVKDLLKAHPNSRLLFVASETTTFAFYPGMELSRRVSNVIFRIGGTAVLFSNKWADLSRAKYRLQHHVRFHTSADDQAYRCISWSPDEEGHLGVYLGKDVVDQPGKALTLALTAISPKIMSWRQLAAAAANLVQRKVAAVPLLASAVGKVKAYQPDFGKCVDYFLIHAGGYAVLRGIQSGMRLPAAAMLPSFAALRDYGNTSASTTWYSFTYLETCVGVKQGQRLMQIGCGGGMKCSIAIWQCLRDVRENHKAWRHLDGPLTEADLPRQISEATKLSAALKGVGTTQQAAVKPGATGVVTDGTAAAAAAAAGTAGAEVVGPVSSKDPAPAAAAAAAAVGDIQKPDPGKNLDKKRDAFAGSKLGQVLSVTHSMAADSAAAAAGVRGHPHQQQQQQEEEAEEKEAVCPAGSTTGSSDDTSCGSDSDVGNPTPTYSVDSDEAAHVTLSIGPMIKPSGTTCAADCGDSERCCDIVRSSSEGSSGSSPDDQADQAGDLVDRDTQSAPRVAMINEDPDEYEFHL